MPKIEKIFTLEITPERFLNACSLTELAEIEILLSSTIARKRREKERRGGGEAYPVTEALLD